jgi:glucokinase
VNGAELVAAGVDLGATGCRVVIVSAGVVLAKRTAPTKELGAGTPGERVARLAALLTSLVPGGSRLARIGIGASGPVELPIGIIRNPDTLLWFSGFDLAKMLGAELGVPVVIDNDAVTAAFGEYRYGAGRGFGRLLVVTLGTGIGVAFLLYGRPFRDRDGQHPECGHLPLQPGGERCYCGLTGCWETIASRASLEARVERVLGTRDLADAERLLRDGAHPALEAAFADYGRSVGRGVEILNVAYSPERIVICGGVSRLLPYFAEGLGAELLRAPGFRCELEVVGSALGDMAGAVGASVLAENEYPVNERPAQNRGS